MKRAYKLYYPNFVKVVLIVCFIFFFVRNVDAVGIKYPCSGDSSLIACYHFNNDSSVGENETLIYDWSGNGNNGTANNIIFNLTGGYFGDGSFVYNGVNSFINFSNKNSLNLNKSMTLSIWYNPKKNNTNMCIIAKRSSIQGYNLCMNSTGGVSFIDNTGTLIPLGFYTSNPNSWYHVAIVINSTGSGITPFLNGVQYPIVKVAPVSNNSINLITGNREGGTVWFNGSIDEILIFNEEKSTQFVKDIYNLNTGNCESRNLFDGCSVISGNSLTLNGSIYYFNDISGLGSIRLNSNSSLDCNGSTLIGNASVNSRGVSYSGTGSDNIVIKNCIVSNYSDNIYLSGNNYTIDNNTVSNSLIRQIVGNPSSNSTFVNNHLFGIGYGIQLYSNSSQCNISYNFIENKTSNFNGGGITTSLSGNFESLIIRNNNFTNVTNGIITNGISTTNYSIIDSNIFNGGRWAIDYRGYHSILKNNIFNNITTSVVKEVVIPPPLKLDVLFSIKL